MLYTNCSRGYQSSCEELFFCTLPGQELTRLRVTQCPSQNVKELGVNKDIQHDVSSGFPQIIKKITLKNISDSAFKSLECFIYTLSS